MGCGASRIDETGSLALRVHDDKVLEMIEDNGKPSSPPRAIGRDQKMLEDYINKTTNELMALRAIRGQGPQDEKVCGTG